MENTRTMGMTPFKSSFCAVSYSYMIFCPQRPNIPSQTMIQPRVGVVVIIIYVVGTTFKNGISQERLELSPWCFTWRYPRLSCFENGAFRKIRACRPAQPTNQTKVKTWDNIHNFWPIELKFGVQVPFTRPHAAVTFDTDPPIFLTYQPDLPKSCL